MAYFKAKKNLNEIFNGTDPIDTVDYSDSNAGIVLTLNANPAQATRPTGGYATGDTLYGIENITGTPFNDTITGNALDNQLIGGLGRDVLRGGDGNDLLIGDAAQDADVNGIADRGPDGRVLGTDGAAGDNDLLDGGAGNDEIYGGAGNDSLLGGFGDDSLYGGAGADLLTGGDGRNLMEGGEGADTLLGSLGDETLRGGAGNDDLNGSTGNNHIEGGDGNDKLLAGTGNDTLNGDAGDDVLDAGGGDDVLLGGAGNDTLKPGAGTDAVDGGDGIDVADYSNANGPVGIDLLNNTTSGAAAGDTLKGIENLTGSAFGDQLYGDSGDNTLIGGAGADTLIGQSGVDTADYSASAAAVSIQQMSTPTAVDAAGIGLGGDAEGDRLLLVERVIGSAFGDTLIGGELNDIFVGGSGADIIDGGLGSDTAEYANSSAAVFVQLDAAGVTTGIGGDAAGDQLSNIERVIGSAYGDTLYGSSADNRLEGRAGDDLLRGGLGADRLAGGDGFDTADYSTSSAAISIGLVYSIDPNAVTTGTGGDAQGDQLSEIEAVIGSAFNDTIVGSVIANLLNGGDGDDLLHLMGADMATGGAGADRFDIQGSGGTIADFNPEDDRLVVVYDPELHPDPQISVSDDGADALVLLDGQELARISGAAGLSAAAVGLRGL